MKKPILGILVLSIIVNLFVPTTIFAKENEKPKVLFIAEANSDKRSTTTARDFNDEKSNILIQYSAIAFEKNEIKKSRYQKN